MRRRSPASVSESHRASLIPRLTFPALDSKAGGLSSSLRKEPAVPSIRSVTARVTCRHRSRVERTDTQSYVSSLDRGQYIKRFEGSRQHRGWHPLQTNICRVLDAAMPDPDRADVIGLAALLGLHNSAPYASSIRVPSAGIEIASASPELYLGRKGRSFGPSRGTARTARAHCEEPGGKRHDRRPVRNDLSRIAEPDQSPFPASCGSKSTHCGPPRVDRCREHGGRDRMTQIIDATFPPEVCPAPEVHRASRLLRSQSRFRAACTRGDRRVD